MESTLERISVNVPSADIMFFRYLANKMGWEVNTRQNLWDEFIKTSPKDVELSDEEIMAEVRAVRYGEASADY
ncbi:hypothetical protein AGMMS49574_23980 [Bacteroidia bacterium]|nr:hypothetical protein AGMMS49574_23980 [Bacteroidia bacterium]GHU54897.1 hypothetical protein FACS189411_02350 [Bacteroidia bacterium]